MLRNSKLIIAVLTVLLVLSIICNFALGFVALDRTIRVNELLGGNDGP